MIVVLGKLTRSQRCRKAVRMADVQHMRVEGSNPNVVVHFLSVSVEDYSKYFAMENCFVIVREKPHD